MSEQGIIVFLITSDKFRHTIPPTSRPPLPPHCQFSFACQGLQLRGIYDIAYYQDVG